MAAPAETVDAVILRTVPFGESDLVVTLLARGRGKLGAFARGARRSSRRFAGALEPFAQVRLDVAERRGSNLLDLRGGSVAEPFLGLRDDLSRLAHAGYAVELVRELLEDRVVNDRLLDLLLSFLTLLSDGPARSLRLRAFELAALDAAGYAPVLSGCARCDGALDGAARNFFEPSAGGVVCGSCVGRRALPFDRASLALLLALQRGGLEAAERASDEGLPIESVSRALRAFVAQHVRHELRSLAFLHEVGAPP